MKKLSEYENEEALDLLADIIEPAVAIIGDAKVKEMYQGKATKIALAQYIIRDHKTDIIGILARLEGIPVEEYKVNLFTLPMKLIEILNDEELISFFTQTASTI